MIKQGVYEQWRLLKDLFKKRVFVLVSVLTFTLVVLSSFLITNYVVKRRTNNYDYLNGVYDNQLKVLETFYNAGQHSYAIIDTRAAEQPGKFSNLSAIAYSLEKESAELIALVSQIKLKILQQSLGTDDIDHLEITYPNDYSSAKKILKSEEYGIQLIEKLNSFSKMALKTVEPVDTTNSNRIERLLNINSINEDYKGTEMFYEEIPLIGSFVLLTALQIRIRIAENECLELLIKGIENSDIRILDFKSIVSPDTIIIKLGNEYSSEIGIGAFDKTIRPEIYRTCDYPYWDSAIVNGYLDYSLRNNSNYLQLPLNKDGCGVYNIKCNRAGNFSYGGLIHYSSIRGDMWIPFNSSYKVKKEVDY